MVPASVGMLAVGDGVPVERWIVILIGFKGLCQRRSLRANSHRRACIRALPSALVLQFGREVRLQA